MHKYTQVNRESQVSQFPQMLNIRQAAKILGVHPDTLRRWEREGILKSARIGTRKDRRYSLADIESLIKNNNSIHDHVLVENPKNLISKAELILFDVADTLITPFPSRGSIISNVALKNGFKINPELAENYFHKKHDDWEKEKLFSDEAIHASGEARKMLYTKLNSDVLKQCGVNAASNILLEMGSEIYTEITENSKCWDLVKNADDFLLSLQKQGKRLGVVENWNKGLIKVLTDLNLMKYFEIVLSGGELGMRKPNKDIFTHVLNILKVPASKTVFIGDRYIDDVLGPKSAHIQTIFYDPKKLTNFVDIPKFSYYSELI